MLTKKKKRIEFKGFSVPLKSDTLYAGKCYLVIQTPSEFLDTLYLNKTVKLHHIVGDLHAFHYRDEVGGFAINYPNKAISKDFVFRRWFDEK